MKKTLVWEILTSFSAKDLKAFDIFLISPFFNKRKDLIAIFRFLRKSIEGDYLISDKHEVLQAAYPNEGYDDKKIGLLFSYLHKLLEKFITIQELHNNDFESKKLLITAYRKKEMHRNFDKTIKQTNKKLLVQPLRNPDYYFTRFSLEYQKYLSLLETGRTQNLNLENVDLYLDFAYVSTKLRQDCYTLSHQAVSNSQYDSTHFDQIKNLIQKDKYKTEPSIVLYYQFIILFQRGGIIEFEHFKKLLFSQINYFRREEFRGIYLLALNFCIKKVNSNEQAFYAETFDMYKKGLEMELLFDKNKLSPFSFSNIVGIAIRQQDLKWTERFINSYRNYLDILYRTPTFSLNVARLEFAKKDYNKALFHLQKADYQDLINHVTAKILQLKIYYELEEFDSLDSLIQSLGVFIRRKKRIGYHYGIWKNILSYTQKVRQVNPYDAKAIAVLSAKIKSETVLPEREWLLAKLYENVR